MALIIAGSIGCGRTGASDAVAIPQTSATAVFGSPVDRKLQSCATLFAFASAPGSVFERLPEKYFGGERDAETLRLLNTAHDSHVLPHS